MRISAKLKQDLIKYNLNFPTDGRAKAFKEQVKKFKLPELYKVHLQSQVKLARNKQQSKERDTRQQVRAEKKKIKKEMKRYVGSVSVVFTYRDKKNFTITKNETIPVDIKTHPSTINNDIIDLIQDVRANRLNKYLVVGFLSNIVDIQFGDYETNVHPVSKGVKKLDSIRMRDSGAGLIDGYDKQDWDTNTGRCVFDYIIHRYGKIKGFITACTYDNLCEVFNREKGEELLKIGVNTEEIMRFCEAHNIPMYAIDDNEKTFKQYIPDYPNKKCPAMIFRLSNKHFYPVQNRSKIQSIIQSTSIINNIDSDMVRDTFQIAVSDDIKDVKDVKFVEDINRQLLDTIKAGKIPERITLKKKELIGFSYGKETFVTNENIDLIKKLCSNMKIEYNGQGVGTLLLEMVKQATGDERVPKSTHNQYVYKTLLDARKDRARIGWTTNDYSYYIKQNLTAWDIIKCYSSCMYEPSEEWIQIDYNDTWEEYDGELKLGIYYVTTNDTTLFKKKGYYSTCIIKKAIQEDIDFTIHKQLVSSNSNKKDYFTKIIDKVLLYSDGDTSISKLVINLMSGMLGQSEKEGSRVKISNDIDQIFNFLDKYHHLDKGIMINRIADTDYYMFGFNQKVTLNESNIPMYIQVVDESNIKLYDMVKKMGGLLVGQKVDCAIVYGCTKEANDTEWGGYKSCDVPTLTRTETIDGVDFTSDRPWNDYKRFRLNDSDKWQEIMNVLVSKKGLLLQASAGNGKTYTAKMIAKSLGKGVKILAPTNKAALNIGGSTIHKFLKMTKEGYISPKLLKLVKERYQYIIVDEISMITKDLWKRLCLLKQETDITFLLLGDEKQCPPVEDEKIDDYFNHPAVKYICNYNKNVLDVRKRYDEKLYNVLEDVDSVNVDEFPMLETPRNICYYNRTRIHVNKLWNDKLKKDGDLFIPENVLDEYTQDMYVYEGMPIIAKKTKHDGGELLFANSETFTIGDIDAEYISMYNERPDENGEKEMYVYACPISEFREYFLMNYCSTTHKSQGETIVENFTIYDWKAMCKKIKYTALSRAKCVEQVCFGKVDFKAVCPNTFATNIDKKIKAHKEFDTLKKYENNIDVKGIQKLFVKQNGECVKCGCSMKTCGYAKGDKEQFSIDRIDSKQGHIKGNVQLMCWGCNRAKKNRF
jgi:hypothetical protein